MSSTMNISKIELFVGSLGFSEQRFATKELNNPKTIGCELPTMDYQMEEINKWIKSFKDSIEIPKEKEMKMTIKRQFSGLGDELDILEWTGEGEIYVDTNKYEKLSSMIQNVLEGKVLRSENQERKIQNEFDTLKNENSRMKQRLEESEKASHNNEIMRKEEFQVQQEKYVTVERKLKLLEDDVSRSKRNYVMTRELHTVKDKGNLLERRIKLAEDDVEQRDEKITKEFRDFQEKYSIVEQKMKKLEDDASQNQEKHDDLSRKLNALEVKNTSNECKIKLLEDELTRKYSIVEQRMKKLEDDASQNQEKHDVLSLKLNTLEVKNTSNECRIKLLEDELSRKNDIFDMTTKHLNDLQEKNELMEQRIKTMEDTNHKAHIDELFERFIVRTEKRFSQVLNNINTNSANLEQRIEKKLKKKVDKVQLLVKKNNEVLIKSNEKTEKDVKDLKIKLATVERNRMPKCVTQNDFNELRNNADRNTMSFKQDIDHLRDLYRTLERSDSIKACVPVEDDKIKRIVQKYDKIKMRLAVMERNVTKNSLALTYNDTDRALDRLMMTTPTTCYRDFDGVPMSMQQPRTYGPPPQTFVDLPPPESSIPPPSPPPPPPMPSVIPPPPPPPPMISVAPPPPPPRKPGDKIVYERIPITIEAITEASKALKKSGGKPTKFKLRSDIKISKRATDEEP